MSWACHRIAASPVLPAEKAGRNKVGSCNGQKAFISFIFAMPQKVESREDGRVLGIPLLD